MLKAVYDHPSNWGITFFYIIFHDKPCKRPFHNPYRQRLLKLRFCHRIERFYNIFYTFAFLWLIEGPYIYNWMHTKKIYVYSRCSKTFQLILVIVCYLENHNITYCLQIIYILVGPFKWCALYSKKVNKEGNKTKIKSKAWNDKQSEIIMVRERKGFGNDFKWKPSFGGCPYTFFRSSLYNLLKFYYSFFTFPFPALSSDNGIILVKRPRRDFCPIPKRRLNWI